MLSAQTERDQRFARLTDELALKNALLEQAEANAMDAASHAGSELREYVDDQRLKWTSLVKERDVELVDMQVRLRDTQARLDELLLSHDQQIGQHERELASVRAKLEQTSPNLRQPVYDSWTRRRIGLPLRVGSISRHAGWTI